VAQALPAVQVAQAPLTQSLLSPQGVPSRAFAPSWQVRPSAPQAIRPSLQGALGFVSHVSAIGQADPSCAPASKLPELTAASTISPIWSGVRPSVQPAVRQHTPIVTDALLICSQL